MDYWAHLSGLGLLAQLHIDVLSVPHTLLLPSARSHSSLIQLLAAPLSSSGLRNVNALFRDFLCHLT